MSLTALFLQIFLCVLTAKELKSVFLKTDMKAGQYSKHLDPSVTRIIECADLSNIVIIK
jgi:hypothetical protein